MMDSDQPQPEPNGRTSILERWPAWAWLAAFVGVIALGWILSALSPDVFYDRFLGPYYVDPIVGDEGYNVVNTAALAVPLLFMLLFAYKVSSELKIKVDFAIIMATLPYLALGSVYRVMEDSDLFAPYGAGRSCLPDAAGPLLNKCFGVFFITPLIYVEVAFMAVGFLILAHEARKISERSRLKNGLIFFAGTLLALVVLYTALWQSNPSWIRELHHPVWILLFAAVCYAIVHRYAMAVQRFDPTVAYSSYGLFVLLPGLFYVIKWMTGGAWAAGPQEPVRWWVLGALVAAPAFVIFAARGLGRAFSNREPFAGQEIKGDAKAAKAPGVPVTVLVLGLLLVSVLLFVSMIAVRDIVALEKSGTLTQDAGRLLRLLGTTALGPVVAVAIVFAAGFAVRSGLPFHPNLIYFAGPTNLVMIFGQMADGLMTALGIDGFHYTEKHVLPDFLIQRVAQGDLIFGLSNWPSAVVMIPLKLFIVLLVVWVIDVSVREPRQNLIGLIKLAIIMVGLSPAIRNATRLAMGT